MFSSKIFRINYARRVVLCRGAVQLSRVLNMILSVKHIFIEQNHQSLAYRSLKILEQIRDNNQ